MAMMATNHLGLPVPVTELQAKLIEAYEPLEGMLISIENCDQIGKTLQNMIKILEEHINKTDRALNTRRFQ